MTDERDNIFDPNEIDDPRPRSRITASDIKELREFVAEQKARKIESLNLYEPLPYQNDWHSCRVKEGLLAKANQIGGSLATFVEVARCALGADPFSKYPKTTKTGKIVCVGYGEKHIGTTIYRYLFRWGAFKIIRDEITQEWRTYRPWPQGRVCYGKSGDLHRKDEARPAPPLIPKRYIDGKISWLKRSMDIFSRVKFTTGWELYAANSEGDPSHLQGLTDVYLYVFDEDVAKSGWYEEAVMRTSSVNGLLRWNAMPHSKTSDIMNFIERGRDEEGKENPRTVVLKVKQSDNPFLSDEAKEENARIAKSMGEDVYRKRILGETTYDDVLMYANFSKYVHDARYKLNAMERDQETAGAEIRSVLQRTYEKLNFTVPQDWTRRVFVDPGHSVCAVGFIATPPPELGNFRLFYKELYLKNNTAKGFAEAMKRESQNEIYYDFLIDMHGARLRGADERMWLNEYQDALEALGVRCEVRGSRFGAACDNIKFREEALRKWLDVRVWAKDQKERGWPTLYVDSILCPNFYKEISHFRKKTVKQGGIDVVIDEANRRGNCHLVEVGEYAAAHGCEYVTPRAPERIDDDFDRWKRARDKRRAQYRAQNSSRTDNTITLGPQGS